MQLPSHSTMEKTFYPATLAFFYLYTYIGALKQRLSERTMNMYSSLDFFFYNGGECISSIAIDRGVERRQKKKGEEDRWGCVYKRKIFKPLQKVSRSSYNTQWLHH